MGFLGTIGKIASFVPGGQTWGAGLSAIDALTAKRQGYDGPNRLMGQGTRDLGQIQDNADRYDTIGNTELDRYEHMGGEDDKAFQDELDWQHRLANGPTSQETLDTQQAYGGNIAGQFGSRHADLMRMLAARGLTGSSVDVGGNTDLTGYEAAARADAMNRAYTTGREQQGQAVGNIAQMIAARRNGALQRGTNLTGAANKDYGSLFTDYSGLAGDQASRIDAQNNAQDEGTANIMNNGGSDAITSLLGKLFAQRRRAPAAGGTGVVGQGTTGGGFGQAL